MHCLESKIPTVGNKAHRGRGLAMVMSRLNQSLIRVCQAKLLEMKKDLVNRARSTAQNFSLAQAARETSGDEIDQTVAQLEEHSFLVNQERIRFQLLEIESALARIETGQFGICEETEEVIENERLLAVPWTRLSIEGAEIREALSKRYMR
jgi:DnaK suppressor protein